ncbi:hypothetical protein PR003_g17324 [Phytophthora rubi]|uniref:Uncharacterized protein n=1 Tax=Phytophthora rubi TaxID=129364 RepID=A0A6A4ERL4_9STRA|nr:hypothetical protein PR003_g17324 [Phytophthora rubi]
MQFLLAKPPSLQTISRALKMEDALLKLSPAAWRARSHGRIFSSILTRA